MITGFLIYLLYALLFNIISLFGDMGTGLSSTVVSAFQTTFSWINTINFVLPVDDMVVALLISISLDVGIWAFRAANYVLNKVRGSSQ